MIVQYLTDSHLRVGIVWISLLAVMGCRRDRSLSGSFQSPKGSFSCFSPLELLLCLTPVPWRFAVDSQPNSIDDALEKGEVACDAWDEIERIAELLFSPPVRELTFHKQL